MKILFILKDCNCIKVILMEGLRRTGACIPEFEEERLSVEQFQDWIELFVKTKPNTLCSRQSTTFTEIISQVIPPPPPPTKTF